MPELDYDPDRFFEAFPRFLESSETGKWNERLHARFRTLVHDNRDLLAGGRVLDLASHDGRFSFAALACGAAEVVGIDVKDHLVDTSRKHFAEYGIPTDRYQFHVGDLYDWIPRLGRFDVVFCFGILYHVCDHMRLFDLLAGVHPKAIIVDTHVSPLEGCVVQFHDPALPLQPPPDGADLEGYPTRDALDAMLSSFGWERDFVDWSTSSVIDRPGLGDYRSGRRVSVVARCPEHAIPDDVRRQAVQEVFAANEAREARGIPIALVADKYGIPRPALRTWVRHAERAAWRAAMPDG